MRLSRRLAFDAGAEAHAHRPSACALMAVALLLPIEQRTVFSGSAYLC